MSASDHPEKVGSADAHAHAFGRSTLFAWLMRLPPSPPPQSPPPQSNTGRGGAQDADNAGSKGGTPPKRTGVVYPLPGGGGGGGAMPSSPQGRRQKTRKAYLRHCLARAAAAAKAVGRAARKNKQKITLAGRALAPEEAGAEEEEGPGAVVVGVVTGEETMCRFLVDEVTRVIEGARDDPGESRGGASEEDLLPAEAAAASAEALFGLGSFDDDGCDNDDNNDDDGAKSRRTGVDAVERFLAAVLKHRLGDAASLRSVRAVASVLYSGVAVAAPCVLPEWSVTTMFER